ncbi:hypothetical protein AAFF_G00220480 [Aldrovandia affinis]|uniref:Uncharacterized protein n=1 Tax=Aldrovandia affinis TaxID=143900 RepID=A0AAD7RGF2_9TELE|nr:hypothetical protein AAFF_G00220480 [Aldrovandia affinis]
MEGGNVAQETVDRGCPSSTPSTERASREKPKKEARPQNTEIRQEARKREEASCEDPCLNDPSCENGSCPPLGEKQNVQKKLKKVEEYCRECTKELGRILRKYEELRTHSRTLEKWCKQLTTENQRLTESLGSRKGETGGSEEVPSALEASVGAKALLEQAHEHCAKVSRDKEQLESKAAALASEAARLREELRTSRLEAQKIWDQGALLDTDYKDATARMGEETRHLYGKLRESEERGEQSECAIRKLRDEQTVLENCLHTVQEERDILQQEVRKLHLDYIELSSSISLQLKGKSSSGHSASLGSHDSPSFGGLLTRQDKLIDREQIDQIRRRLEEEELTRAQKYKNMNQSE